MKNIHPVFILLAAIFVSFSNFAHSEYKEATWEKTIGLKGETCRIYLENPSGIIRVKGENRADVHLLVRRLSDKSNPENVKIEVVENDGLKIFIRMPSADRPVIQDMPYMAHVDMAVPSTCDLRFRAKVYVLDVRNVKGSIELDGINGNVSLVHVSGGVSLRLVNGAVTVQQSQGFIRVENKSGDIKLTEHEGCIQVESVNADLTFDFKALAERCRVQAVTVNGNVDLTLPDIPLHLDLRTILGMIRVEMDARVEKQDASWDKHLVAVTGEARDRLRVDVRTTNGRITIYRQRDLSESKK